MSSFVSSFKGHNDATRSSRGPESFSADKKKTSWAAISRPASNEPVELPDISTCPNAYANNPQADAGSKSAQEEIRIGIRPVETGEMSSDPTQTHGREPSRSSSVMIMYVKSWLPGASPSSDGRYSVRSSSALRKGSTQSIASRDEVSPYESRLASSNNNYAQAWQQQQQQQHQQQHQHHQQQQQQQQPLEFSPIDENLGVPPLTLYTDKEIRLSWASTASSDYSVLDDVSEMTNTTTRKSAPRIPISPEDRRRYL